MNDVRIESISIADTFGCRAVNFRPGTVTRITGGNGEGKSSILRGLLYIFSGGLDAQVIRKGAEKSVVSFTLSNGVTVTKTTAPIKRRKGADPNEPVRYKADLEITDADGTPMPAPQSFIADLSEALAVDPSVLLRIDTTTAPGKAKIAAELMRLVPVSFDPEEVSRACSYRSSDRVDFYSRDTIALPESPTTPINLDGLKKVTIQVTEQRRRVGQTRDETDGAVTRLQKSLPEDDGVDYSARLGALEEQRVAFERALGNARLGVEEQKAEALGIAQKECSDATQEAEREYAEALAVLERKRSESKAAAMQLFAERKEAVMANVADLLRRIDTEAKPELDRISTELATTKERLQAHHRAATLREEIESQLTTCRAAAWKYDQLSAVLANLESLRLEKLNHLPVAGLVVEEGEAYLDGIAWDKVNLARRVEAVLQICTQRSGKLPLLIVDDAEHLDSETRKAIEQGLAAAGFQLIEAVVRDGPLSIECLTEVAA